VGHPHPAVDIENARLVERATGRVVLLPIDVAGPWPPLA
jgi:hypothetical protein